MNKIIYILCSAFLLSLGLTKGYSQENETLNKATIKSDSLVTHQQSDTISRKLVLDSIQTLNLLKRIVETDSLRRKLKTDTINNKLQLDSVQTKKLLEQLLTKVIKQKKKTKKDIEYEVDGLIVAKTISRAGRDFYDIFFSKWQAPKGAKNFIIEINEKPIPQMGTEITIVVKEIEVFQEKIQPRYDIIEEYAKYAIHVVKDFLKHFNEIQKELNGEDLSGSGIF